MLAGMLVGATIALSPGAARRARYGPHIRVRVIAKTLYSPACTNLWDAVAGPGPDELTIGWEAGGGARFDHVEVAEHDDRVVIGVVAQAPNGFRTLESHRGEHILTLSHPLGGRKVIDATTGEAVGSPEPSRARRRPPRAPRRRRRRA